MQSHFKHCRNDQESGKAFANLTQWCCSFILEICRKGGRCPQHSAGQITIWYKMIQMLLGTQKMDICMKISS